MFDREVVSFAHGDGLGAPDSAVIAAGVAALLDQARFPLQRYNFLERHEPLEAAIRATMRSEEFSENACASMCVDSGTTKLILSFLQSVTEPGDAVLVAPTFYHGLVGWVRLLHLGLQLVPTSAANAYKLDSLSIEHAIDNARHRWSRRPRALVVFNPTQTGAIYTAAELDDVADCCARFDLDVLEDSIFGRTRFDQQPTCTLGEQPVGRRACCHRRWLFESGRARKRSHRVGRWPGAADRQDGRTQGGDDSRDPVCHPRDGASRPLRSSCRPGGRGKRLRAESCGGNRGDQRAERCARCRSAR